MLRGGGGHPRSIRVDANAGLRYARGTLTKRGEKITVTCAWCEEDFPHTVDRGRLPRYHPADHKVGDKLTHCRWNANNAERAAREIAKQANEQARIDAAVDAKLAKAVQAQVPVSLTEDERRELLSSIREARGAITLLLGRTHEKASAQVTLGHYRTEVKERIVPLLVEFEEILRRK